MIIQRVSAASVNVKGENFSSIGVGMLLLAGIEESDSNDDITWMSRKIINLRIFDDEEKVPNLSVTEAGADILLVSQFTLHASTKKGNRPSYIKAAKPVIAIPIYEAFVKQLENDLGKKIKTGQFGGDMKVSLVNDGPLTIFIDTKNKE